MVEARLTIQLSAARPEVHDHPAPAPGASQAQQPDDVVRARRAFEAVEDQDERRVRRTVQPVEVEEVSVSGGDPLAPQRDATAADERAPDGLEVSASTPPGRAKSYS
jgi:hypothetical protein